MKPHVIVMIFIAMIYSWMVGLPSILITSGSADIGRTDEHGSFFSMCDREGWKWVQLDGHCWNNLIKLEATTTWMDITVIIGYALILFCSVALILYKCTKLSKKYPLGRFYDNVIVIIAIVMMFMVILKACFLSQLYLTSARPEQTNAISSQLSKSLLQYGHDENITRAWQNTMREGCCCGLHGYQDFTNIGVDVPPQCGCYDEKEQPCLYKGCTRRYNSGSHKLSDCTAAPNTNFTNAGCLSFVEDKVDHSTKLLAVFQFVTVVLSVVFILVNYATTNKTDTRDSEADSDKGQVAQKKTEKKTVYSYSGSLSKILVRIRLRERMM